MEILKYNNEEVNQEETAIIDESSILSISWIHDGLDLEMAIDWNGKHGPKYRDKKLKTFLIFKWVSGLKINLDWGILAHPIFSGASLINYYICIM